MKQYRVTVGEYVYYCYSLEACGQLEQMRDAYDNIMKTNRPMTVSEYYDGDFYNLDLSDVSHRLSEKCV